MKDVLIVGSGAGGAPLALRLSQAGFDVLVLEKGPRYARSDFRHDELQVGRQSGFFVPRSEDEPHILLNNRAATNQPAVTVLGWTACCVGGGTAHMGGSLYRFHPDDFRLRERLGPFEAVVDWPFDYEDLEPYYSQAEWEVGVSGGSHESCSGGFRSRPYPMPPVQRHPLASVLANACRTLGLHPFSTPRAINSEPYAGRPACADCDYCAGFGCPTGARGSMAETLLPRAERTGRCEIRPRCMVTEIIVEGNGRATGCVYVDEAGVQHRVRGRLVCICCSAVESARLLLMSTSPLFPSGLANRSGQVGHHLQFHSTSTGRGRFRYDKHPSLGLRERGFFLGWSVMDHYFLPTGTSPFRKGGLLRFDLDQVHPIATAQALVQREAGRILWGEPLKRAMRAHFCDFRDVEFEVFHDFIPNEGTFIELDPDVKDQWGLPVARIHLDEPEHHHLAGQWLLDRGLEVLEGMGADELVPGVVGQTTSVMVHGTCRAGASPVDSVLNPYCQTHDVPNLFVVDGSFLPTSGGAPSTLTIIANSLRTADYIVSRARTLDFP